MSSFQSVFTISLTAILLLSTVEARCHNLSSTAFAHCPKYSGAADEVVKAAATAPFPITALATGGAQHQEKVQQKAAVKAQDNLPSNTSTDATPWLYGTEGKLMA